MLYFCSTLEEYKNLKSKLSFKTLGLVPTMGNLHEGHMSLLKASLDDNDVTVLSIFVNPKQFGKNEDFEDYPRTLEEDLQKIEKLLNNKLMKKETDREEVVIVFSPKSEEEVFPKGFNENATAGKLGKVLEGERRPTHFDGVVTVVKRLFKMFQPNRAYFGKKDYQQLLIVQKLIEKEGLKVKLEAVPIAREASGLAMSSRNTYLDEKQKEKALNLRKALLMVKKELEKNKDLGSAKELAAKLQKEDRAFNYLVVKDAQTLEEPENLEKPLVVLGSYQVDKTSLLDNIEVDNIIVDSANVEDK